MAKYIHGTSEIEQDRLARLNHLLNDRCAEKIRLEGNEKLLDIGCGLGIFSRQLAHLLPDGSVIGVEKEQAQIDRGRIITGVDLTTDYAQIRQGSAYRLPLEQDEWASFDFVFIRFLLEHLTEPERAVAQAKKALKPGGRIVLVDDDHANFRITPEQPAFSRLWAVYCQVYEQLGNDPFIGRNLTTLLKQAGFEKLTIDFVLFGATADEDDFVYYANNLIGILEGAKVEMSALYPVDEDLDSDLEDIRTWSGLADATLWYAANWVEGYQISY